MFPTHHAEPVDDVPGDGNDPPDDGNEPPAVGNTPPAIPGGDTTLHAFKNVVLIGGPQALMAGVTDANNDPLSASLTRPPTTGGIVTVGSDGSFRFTPNKGNKKADVAADFQVAISDGNTAVPRTLKVTIGVSAAASGCVLRVHAPCILRACFQLRARICIAAAALTATLTALARAGRRQEPAAAAHHHQRLLRHPQRPQHVCHGFGHRGQLAAHPRHPARRALRHGGDLHQRQRRDLHVCAAAHRPQGGRDAHPHG